MKQQFWWILMVIAVAAGYYAPSICPAMQKEVKPILLENEVLRLGFGPHAEGFSVQTLTERTTGTDFIQGPPTGPLWVIELRHRDGHAVEVTNNETAAPFIDYADSVTRTLLWKHVAVGQETEALSVRVVVRLDARDPRLSHWRIWVENHSKNWGIWVVQFPLVGGLGTGDDAYYVWPLNVGNKVHEPLTRLPMWGPYPTASPSMQFSVVGAEKAALYVATHDPLAYHKEANFEDDGQGAARIRYAHFPEGMGEPGRDYRVPYEVTIGVLAGDWIDACKLYRSWALEQKWCAPPLAQRDDVPQWFKDVAVWFQGSPTDKMIELAKFLDVPTALNWYNWHQIRFDDDYPEYFPARPEVPMWTQKLREAGIRMVPYINARLWDIDTESYAAQEIERHVVKKQFLKVPEQEKVRSYGAHLVSSEPDGEPFIESYSGSTFGVMCPVTELWQDKVASLCERIVGELGMDGVYFDQTASHIPRLCFNPAHGHRIGGGHFWVSANRELVRKSRQRMRAINPATILTSESVAEPYSFDALLNWDATFHAPDLAPMYQYVYSGYMVTFGRIAAVESRGLDQQFAQCFIWGTQLGWHSASPDRVDPATPNGQYLKEVARVYTDHAKRFTFYGEMLRPAKTLNEVSTESSKWMRNHDRPVTMPLAVHSLWRAPDGALGLILTNWDDGAQPVELQVPVTHYLEGAVDVQVVDLTTGENIATVVNDGKLRLNLAMAPRSARVLEIQSR